MARTSLKRIRTWIEMHNMVQDIEVSEYTNEPIPVEGLDKIKYMIMHRQFGPPWKSVYYCETINDTADCVNRIIWDLPIEDNCTVIGKDKKCDV